MKVRSYLFWIHLDGLLPPDGISKAWGASVSAYAPSEKQAALLAIEKLGLAGFEIQPDIRSALEMDCQGMSEAPNPTTLTLFLRVE